VLYFMLFLICCFPLCWFLCYLLKGVVFCFVLMFVRFCFIYFFCFSPHRMLTLACSIPVFILYFFVIFLLRWVFVVVCFLLFVVWCLLVCWFVGWVFFGWLVVVCWFVLLIALFCCFVVGGACVHVCWW